MPVIDAATLLEDYGRWMRDKVGREDDTTPAEFLRERRAFRAVAAIAQATEDAASAAPVLRAMLAEAGMSEEFRLTIVRAIRTCDAVVEAAQWE